MAFLVATLFVASQTVPSLPLTRLLVTADPMTTARRMAKISAASLTDDQSKELGLIRKQEGRFEIYLDRNLWNPPRLLRAILAIDRLRRLDLRNEVRLSDFLETEEGDVPKRIGSLMKGREGEGTVQVEKPLRIRAFVRSVVELNGAKRYVTDIQSPQASGLSGQRRTNLADIPELRPPLPPPDALKGDLLFAFGRPTKSITYNAGIETASDLLTKRNRYWDELYRATLDDLTATHFPKFAGMREDQYLGDAATWPPSFYEVARYAFHEPGKGLPDIRTAKAGSPTFDLELEFEVSEGVGVALTMRQLFDLP